MKKILLLVFVILISIPYSYGQSTLTAGDVAFVGLNRDNGTLKGFSFILLTSIEAGTEIQFTDKGWSDTTGFVDQSSDSVIIWTTTSALSFGTVVNIPSAGTPSIGTIDTGTVGLDVSRIADQVFAFQGAQDLTSNVLAGINASNTTDAANWDGDVTNNRTSALPDVLTTGGDALQLPEEDNAIYNCAVTAGTNDIRMAINDANNWTFDNSNNITLNPFPCTFSLLAPLTAGDVAFVGLNRDNGTLKGFSFILLTSIEAGTEIQFTDKGWSDTTGFVDQSGDSVITWTTTSALSFGTVVNIPSAGAPSIGTIDTGTVGLDVSRIADQVFAFQGAQDLTSNVLAGINASNTTDAANWDGGVTNNRTSALPDVLTTGVNAVQLPEEDNAIYNCGITSGVNAIRTAINDANNWTFDNSNNITLNPFPCTFSDTVICPDTLNLTVDNIMTNSVDLIWTLNTDATAGYTVEVFNTGEDPNVATAIFTENVPVGTSVSTVTGLTEGNTYDGYVSANCGGLEGTVATITFNVIVCNPFNSFSIAPGNPTDTSIVFSLDPIGPRLIQVFNTGEDPNIATPISSESIALFVENLIAGNTYDAYAYADCGADGLSEPLMITFTTETCYPVTDLVASNATPNGFQIDWVEDSIGTTVDPSTYSIGVFEAGVDPDTSTPIFTDTVPFGTTTYTVNDNQLQSLTFYDVYVRSDCELNGVDTSTGIGINVRTAIAPPTCSVDFFDTEGPSMNYLNSQLITTTIMPDIPGDAVTVTFTSVDIEVAVNELGVQDGCFDFLTIYNGADASAPILEMTLCGEPSGSGEVSFVPSSRLNIGDSFTSTDPSGALTFVFTSDGLENGLGWTAEVSCGTLSNEVFSSIVTTIAPNPSSDFISITSNKIINKYEIFNLLGQKVSSNTVASQNRNQEIKIDVSNFNTGTYIMKIMTNTGEVSIQKFIKVNK